MKPIVVAQEAVLRGRERDDLIPLVPRYNTFLLLLAHAGRWCMGP